MSTLIGAEKPFRIRFRRRRCGTWSTKDEQYFSERTAAIATTTATFGRIDANVSAAPLAPQQQPQPPHQQLPPTTHQSNTLPWPGADSRPRTIYEWTSDDGGRAPSSDEERATQREREGGATTPARNRHPTGLPTSLPKMPESPAAAVTGWTTTTTKPLAVAGSLSSPSAQVATPGPLVQVAAESGPPIAATEPSQVELVAALLILSNQATNNQTETKLPHASTSGLTNDHDQRMASLQRRSRAQRPLEQRQRRRQEQYRRAHLTTRGSAYPKPATAATASTATRENRCDASSGGSTRSNSPRYEGGNDSAFVDSRAQGLRKEQAGGDVRPHRKLVVDTSCGDERMRSGRTIRPTTAATALKATGGRNDNMIVVVIIIVLPGTPCVGPQSLVIGKRLPHVLHPGGDARHEPSEHAARGEGRALHLECQKSRKDGIQNNIMMNTAAQMQAVLPDGAQVELQVCLLEVEVFAHCVCTATRSSR